MKRMTKLDASNAKCHVFTYKEGLLSSVAHDLELELTKFSIEIDSEKKSLRATFDPGSLEVIRAVGATISDDDKETIEKNAREDVLQVKRYPNASFVSTEITPQGVRGKLTLHGTERDVVVSYKTDGGQWIAEVRLHQPDFGIKPFSAMLGTLRVKPDVLVRITAPASPG